MDSCAIEIKDLTKFYGSQRGIEGIDLSVAAGEVVGFLGPNGAGKTTTIRLLLDLLRPQRGAARVLGLDCQQQGLEVRRRIGYLPDEYRLYENLTGKQILRFLGNVGGRIDWSYTHELADRLGIDLSRSIRTLSHGNKQKLAIILAFQHRAPLLILDEPTNGLDPLVQQEFFSLVAAARSEGRTVFLSSHNLTEVERVCDRVASVREGRLVAGEIEMKSIDLLMARPVPRWRVAVGKFVALVTATVIIAACVAASAIICARFIETDISAGYLLLSTLNALPLTWLFAALALFFSCRLPRARQASLVTGFIVVTSYMFETLRLLSPSIRSWDEVSLFAHQKAGFTLAGEIHWGPILLLLALVILITVAAAVAFERRDLAS